jgi:hypothetical protein
MDVVKFLLTVVSATIASSFTDWFFMGILFHEKYKSTPEIWRNPAGGSETKAILWAVAINFFAFALFVFIANALRVNGFEKLLLLAFFSWLVGALPVLITNALFIKLHPLVVVSNALGWLVKFCLIAVAFEIFLGQ